ncbi:MAG: 6-phosphogluconolactonase [bacterium]
MSEVRTYPDLESLSLAAAEGLAAEIQQVVERRHKCSFVLTGGRTPRRMYELLALRFGATIPWAQVDLFWGDERYVPHDDPRSNYRLARVSLLDQVAVPPQNIHPMPTDHADSADAADEYEEFLRRYLSGRRRGFDVLLLGMAANGHVASLFPQQPSLHERERWVIATEVPADPPQRITMTLPLINEAAYVAFLVAGPSKAEAVRRALEPGASLDDVPASGVAPKSGRVVWWLDSSAAAQLPDKQQT